MDEPEERTCSSSSSLGFAFSFLLSSTAFWNSAELAMVQMILEIVLVEYGAVGVS